MLWAASIRRRVSWNKARNGLIEAVALVPKCAWAHYNLGLIFRRHKRVDEAAREFRLALDSDPQFQPARQALEQLGPANP
jgi:tetratricopeptide (TPR) repeat protein